MRLIEKRTQLQDELAQLAGRKVETVVDTPIIKPKTNWFAEIIGFLMVFKIT
jgi:hypothetical protein